MGAIESGRVLQVGLDEAGPEEHRRDDGREAGRRDRLSAAEGSIAVTLWKPHPGPQTRFLASASFEALYGGAAGGGKSQALVFGALAQLRTPRYHALILRRTFPELQELIDLSLATFPQVGGTWNEQKKRWTWPGGQVVEFGYCESYKDVLQYQGDAFQYVGWDELGQIAEERIWLYLKSRVRKTHPAQRLEMRASANPGGPGHYWLKARFVDCCPPDGSPVTIAGETRAFFPALLQDNPTLVANDPGYAERLKDLPELEYRWLGLGDWSAGGGLAFPELGDLAPYLMKPRLFIPDYWTVWAGFDWGYNHPYACCLFAGNEDGQVIWMDTDHGRRRQPPEIAEGFREMLKRYRLDGRRFDIHAGHDCWADIKARSEGVPTLAEQFRAEGFDLVKANISRIAGVQNIRQYLRGPEPRLTIWDTPGNRKALACLASRVSDPDRIEDVLKQDADERGNGGDDAYDAFRYGLAARMISVKAPAPRGPGEYVGRDPRMRELILPKAGSQWVGPETEQGEWSGGAASQFPEQW